MNSAVVHIQQMQGVTFHLHVSDDGMKAPVPVKTSTLYQTNKNHAERVHYSCGHLLIKLAILYSILHQADTQNTTT